MHNENGNFELYFHYILGWEEHRQASPAGKSRNASAERNGTEGEEGLASVIQLMEARNRLLVAKAEKIRVRLQYELTSRLTMYYRTGSFINH